MWNCSTNPRALQECISHTTYKFLSLDFGLYKKWMFTLGINICWKLLDFPLVALL